jgi:outer membrane biosynthesis protein TonB
MKSMMCLRPPRGLLRRLVIALALVSCLTGGASATAGLRPDPKPPPPPPRPEPPPQTRVSPQPPPAQPPPAQPAVPEPAPAPHAVVPATARPARTTDRPKRLSTRGARRGARPGAALERQEKLTRTVASGSRRPAIRAVAPAAFSDPQSNVGTIVLGSMVALAAVLLLVGFGATPARAARWPAAARVLDDQADVLVVTGLALLAASGAFLVFFLMLPA